MRERERKELEGGLGKERKGGTCLERSDGGRDVGRVVVEKEVERRRDSEDGGKGRA